MFLLSAAFVLKLYPDGTILQSELYGLFRTRPMPRLLDIPVAVEDACVVLPLWSQNVKDFPGSLNKKIWFRVVPGLAIHNNASYYLDMDARFIGPFVRITVLYKIFYGMSYLPVPYGFTGTIQVEMAVIDLGQIWLDGFVITAIIISFINQYKFLQFNSLM